MIDFHSHILPGIDDGSHDVSESLTLLQMLAEQTIDTVVATPHFYADRESVDSFLHRRAMAYAALEPSLTPDLPRVLCGAEVRYYAGISHLAQLSRLCVEGSSLLLLEMPVAKWTEYTVRELIELSANGAVTLAIAHVERYMGLQTEGVMRRLYESGILMQFNASFFLALTTKRRAMSLLQSGGVHLIGSDCHNLSARPPRIGKACEAIHKKLGTDFLTPLDGYGRSLLCL